MSVELALQPLRRAVVTASALRLRDKPEVTAVALSSVPRGTQVDVLGVTPDGLWTQVKAGRRIGWVSSKYLVAEDHPLVPKSPREEFAWMPIAALELGVAETAGPGSSARVLEYLASTNLHAALAKDDSTPWCSAFVNWCVEKAGFAGTDSAAARSWLGWGREIPGAAAGLHRGLHAGHEGRARRLLRGPIEHAYRRARGQSGQSRERRAVSTRAPPRLPRPGLSRAPAFSVGYGSWCNLHPNSCLRSALTSGSSSGVSV